MKRIALVVLALALAVHGLAAQDLERLFKAAGIPMTVSPDARYIVYSTPIQGQNRLVVHDLSSGVERTLDLGNGKAYDPFITPDSKRVLYTWWGFKDELGELRIVNLDGTG